MTDPLVKVPVVLAEPRVSINVDETFTLPIPASLPGALQIKTIGKRVKLTQCLLALPSNILFLKGYVRKDIQYAVVEGAGTSETPAVVSNMRDYTLDIPISTQVDLSGTYLTPPVRPTVNSRTEFEFFTSTPLPSSFPEKDKLLAGDLTEFNQTNTEYFNELPFCELVSASIVEYDEYINRTSPIPLPNTPFEEGVFRTVEEKMVVTIDLKVLQKQQVNIT